MSPEELTREEWDTLARHLGVENISQEQQWTAMMQHGEESFQRVYSYLLENCPPEHQEEFVARIGQDPKTSGFKEFVMTIMPGADPFLAVSSPTTNQ